MVRLEETKVVFFFLSSCRYFLLLKIFDDDLFYHLKGKFVNKSWTENIFISNFDNERFVYLSRTRWIKFSEFCKNLVKCAKVAKSLDKTNSFKNCTTQILSTLAIFLANFWQICCGLLCKEFQRQVFFYKYAEIKIFLMIFRIKKTFLHFAVAFCFFSHEEKTPSFFWLPIFLQKTNNHVKSPIESVLLSFRAQLLKSNRIETFRYRRFGSVRVVWSLTSLIDEYTVDDRW